MKYGVSPSTLLFMAGLIWIIAGANILRIGLYTWSGEPAHWYVKAGEALCVFLLFFGFIFRKIYHKSTFRISQKGEKNCPFSFFDFKGWLIMLFMMTLGITVRKWQLLPSGFIAVFYTGLSIALIATGGRFLFFGYRFNKKRI